MAPALPHRSSSRPAVALVAAGLTVLTVACQGSQVAAGPRSPATPAASTAPGPATPSPPSGALFVLLRSIGSPTHSNDSISIVDAAGRQVAAASFKPRSGPNTGDLGALLEPEATAAAGKAFYWDGDGVVRTLSPTGVTAEVARYPLTSSQQELSVAVSPDGTQLMAALLTLPQPARAAAGNVFFQNAPYQLDIYSGPAGAAQVVVRHQEGVINTFSPVPALTAMVTWDAGGPLAISPQILGTQGGSRHQWFGTLVRLARDGSVAAAAAGAPDCRPEDVSRDGYSVCVVDSEPDRGLRVMTASGQTAWQQRSGLNSFAYPRLAPDHKRVLTSVGAAEVVAQDGSVVTLPTNFVQDGWVDDSQVIGTLNLPAAGAQHEALIKLSDPGVPIDLGYQATFVGAL